MKRIALILALATVLPAAAAAQQEDAIERLPDILPPDVAEQVLLQIQAAQAQELPAQAMANLALEGWAKGRSPDEVLGAVETLVADMGRAQEALLSVGYAPVGGDVEAATAAMRMGVDGEAVSDLARARPWDRSMAVPLLVLGALNKELPTEEALAAVMRSLDAGAGDAELLGDFPEIAQGLGMRPEQVGPALAGGFGGFQVPVAGITVPIGKPSDLPGRRGRRPGGSAGGV